MQWCASRVIVPGLLFSEVRAINMDWGDPAQSMVDLSRPLACDAWLARGSDLLVEWRAFSTWRAYATHITAALAWLREQVEASHMKWHAETLRKEPQFFLAFAVYKLETAETLTAFKKPIQALRMAMRINNIPVKPDFLTAVVREVNRRRRSKSVRKRPGLLFSPHLDVCPR